MILAQLHLVLVEGKLDELVEGNLDVLVEGKLDSIPSKLRLQ